MTRKVLEFIVLVGALKALIPTPGHAFELGELTVAFTWVAGIYAARYLLNAAKTTLNAKRNPHEDGANPASPSP